ncbi:MAG TPA: DMT family transporter [Pseudonocardiaceae bacterium]|nr:DMT family transporter [Pseudonocardiaceae bacterium]
MWTPSLRAALDSRPSKSTLRAARLVATLALLWGSGFFWIKLSLGGFTPTQLTFGRLALGTLALWPIVLIRRLARPRGRMIWAHLALSALTANALPYTLFAIAQQTVSSSLAGIINRDDNSAVDGRYRFHGRR